MEELWILCIGHELSGDDYMHPSIVVCTSSSCRGHIVDNVSTSEPLKHLYLCTKDTLSFHCRVFPGRFVIRDVDYSHSVFRSDLDRVVFRPLEAVAIVRNVMVRDMFHEVAEFGNHAHVATPVSLC